MSLKHTNTAPDSHCHTVLALNIMHSQITPAGYSTSAVGTCCKDRITSSSQFHIVKYAICILPAIGFESATKSLMACRRRRAIPQTVVTPSVPIGCILRCTLVHVKSYQHWGNMTENNDSLSAHTWNGHHVHKYDIGPDQWKLAALMIFHSSAVHYLR